MTTTDWFSRGRDSYTEGKPCYFDDSRTSSAGRRAWYEGWNHQRNLNTQPAAKRDLEETISALEEIKQSLK
jgi:hypothetical protein